MIERVLGSGGFGITYLAKDTSLGRRVVVKENLPSQFVWRDTNSGTVRPRHTTGNDADDFEWSMRNFLREAETLASMDHPGIVRVLRKFEANGTAYFVMPFVEGLPFDRLIEDRRSNGEVFSEDELGGLLSRMLESLGHIHASGIYHRDIKPANILITNEGIPVLIDFGSARQRLSDRSMTVVESAGYTPFEQLQSQGNVGPWSDLYALGATIVKALTFEALPKATDRIRRDPHVPLAERNELTAGISLGFLKAIDRATAVDEEERWQNAGQWLDAMTHGWQDDAVTLSTTGTASTVGGIRASVIPVSDSSNASAGAFGASPPPPPQNQQRTLLVPRTLALGGMPVMGQAMAKPKANKGKKAFLGIAALGLIGIAVAALNSGGKLKSQGALAEGSGGNSNAVTDVDRVRAEALKQEQAKQQDAAMAAKRESDRIRAEAAKAEQARIDAEVKRELEEADLQREAAKKKREAEEQELAKAKAKDTNTTKPGANAAPPPFLTKDPKFPTNAVIAAFNLANPNSHPAALLKANEIAMGAQKLAKLGREQEKTTDHVSGLNGRHSSYEHIRQQGRANIAKASENMREAQEIRAGVAAVQDYLKALAKETAGDKTRELILKDKSKIKGRIIGEIKEGLLILMANDEWLVLKPDQLANVTPADPNKRSESNSQAKPVPTTMQQPARALVGVSIINEKLRRIVIPRVSVDQEVTLEEMVDFLRLRSIELDTIETDPAKKGISFMLQSGEGKQNINSIEIEFFFLNGVPLGHLLKYLCDNAGVQYKVDDYGVTILPK